MAEAFVTGLREADGAAEQLCSQDVAQGLQTATAAQGGRASAYGCWAMADIIDLSSQKNNMIDMT